MTTAKIPTDDRVWSGIDYQPAIRAHLPEALIPFLAEGSRILDVGCNTGIVVRFLTEKGMEVEGVDLNPAAIATAQQQATQTVKDGYPRFHLADFLNFTSNRTFDAIVMIRFLTCVPESDRWQACLDRAAGLLSSDGLLYIHDFAHDPNSLAYGPRYAEGQGLGWREGNFPVRRPDGTLQFIAHHHTEADLVSIRSRFDIITHTSHPSTSMNGNPCLMFECIGRNHRNT